MDMDILQEYSENQCYLRAISNVYLVELEFKLDPVSLETIQANRLTEKFENVLYEPIGNFMFKNHLKKTDSFEFLLFLTEVEFYETLPGGFYRNMTAKKIYRKYLSPNAFQPIGYTDSVIKKLIDNNKESSILFGSAKAYVYSHLLLSHFRSFLLSKYYSRLLSFREHEKKKLTRDDFDFIRILGEGGFGKVFAVSRRETRAVYACKAMNKLKISEKRRENLILNERDILIEVNSPFIINLKYALQDDSTLYLIIDLMTGGELQYHLNRFTKFSEKWVVFYTASIALAIDFFHSHNIVYRDLKPENVLLDDSGFIRITDLGLCSFLKPDEKLNQHCGTRSFMAPEQSFGDEGYDHMVDWWALGVTIYYQLTGSNPFSRTHRRSSNIAHRKLSERRLSGRGSGNVGGSAQFVRGYSQRTYGAKEGLFSRDDDNLNDRERRHQEYRDRIEERLLTIRESEDFLSSYARDIILKLLVINPKERLGYHGSDEVKAHPFFRHINWKKLQHRHISPPFVPNPNHVHAEYLESAYMGLSKSTVKNKSARAQQCDEIFKDRWEYTRPMIFQEEVLDTLHDKYKLAHSPKLNNITYYNN